MHNVVRLAAAIALVTGFSSGLTAKDTNSAKSLQIGAKAISVDLIDGYCYLQETQPVDTRLLKALAKSIAGRNRLLAGFANCKELKDWREGKRVLLDQHGNFQTLLSAEHSNITASPAKMAEAVCSQFRNNKIDIGKILDDSKQKIEKSLPGVKLNEQKFLGEIETTKDACFAGVYQKFRAQNGTIKRQLGVFATMVINNKILYAYLFRPEAGAESMKKLLADIKKLVETVVSANRD